MLLRMSRQLPARTGWAAADAMRSVWIQTDPNKGWFQMLRFYFPAKAVFDKTSQAGETEKVK